MAAHGIGRSEQHVFPRTREVGCSAQRDFGPRVAWPAEPSVLTLAGLDAGLADRVAVSVLVVSDDVDFGRVRAAFGRAFTLVDVLAVDEVRTGRLGRAGACLARAAFELPRALDRAFASLALAAADFAAAAFFAPFAEVLVSRVD